jgi:hypothetical protein
MWFERKIGFQATEGFLFNVEIHLLEKTEFLNKLTPTLFRVFFEFAQKILRLRE